MAIVQFKIINPGGHDRYYTHKVLVDGSEKSGYRDLVSAGQSNLYIYYFYPTGEGKKEVNIIVYEEGKAEPIENITYYIFVGEGRE